MSSISHGLSLCMEPLNCHFNKLVSVIGFVNQFYCNYMFILKIDYTFSVRLCWHQCGGEADQRVCHAHLGCQHGALHWRQTVNTCVHIDIHPSESWVDPGPAPEWDRPWPVCDAYILCMWDRIYFHTYSTSPSTNVKTHKAHSDNTEIGPWAPSQYKDRLIYVWWFPC